jgi:hypothetical protein
MASEVDTGVRNSKVAITERELSLFDEHVCVFGLQRNSETCVGQGASSILCCSFAPLANQVSLLSTRRERLRPRLMKRRRLVGWLLTNKSQNAAMADTLTNEKA